MRINEELAELMGVMLGDGCLSTYTNQKKYMIYIAGHKVDDFEYHNINTRKLFKSVFNKDIKICFRKDENTLFIRFSDKKIFHQFQELGVAVGWKYDHIHVPSYLRNSDRLMFAFLRGLIDTDGSVVFSKQHRGIPYYPRIEIASKSRPFLIEIMEFLREKGFYGSVSKKMINARLEIPGKKNLALWMEKVGFSNPKHFNKIKMAPSARLELATSRLTVLRSQPSLVDD